MTDRVRRPSAGPAPAASPPGAVASAGGSPAPRRRGGVRALWRRLTWWQEGLLLAFVLVCVALLVRGLVLAPFLIPSGSMERTLRVGDEVLVYKLAYTSHEPRRGEVVVFRGTDRWAPESGSEDYVKRVVGLPGDVVDCCDRAGRVRVNGHPLTEPYVYDNASVDDPVSVGECRSRRFGPYTVPNGGLFVLGDHRRTSQDSRCRGAVPRANLIGRAVAVGWPIGHWRTLPVPATFRDVPSSSR